MTAHGPLHGLRVVELEGLAPAPFGCMVLADLGAEVLRVDRPTNRATLSPPRGPLDRGRSTIAVDLKDPEGVALVRDLVRSADVFVEGLRPGATERLGLGPDDLLRINSRLIYARLTGWGQAGPLRHRAGHDINYIALAGALQPIARAGERPLPPLNLIGDFAGGGLLMVVGILAALYERMSSGKGQVIDAAMIDGASLLMTFIHGLHAVGMWHDEPGTNPLDSGAPFYDTYECKDGAFVAVGCVEPQFFAEFVSGIGVEDDDLPFYLNPTGWPQLRERIAEAFLARTRDEWAAHFAETDACVTPVLSPWEAAAHAHHQHRQGFVSVGGVPQPAPAPRFSRTPAAHPVPADQHGRDVERAVRTWGVGEHVDLSTLISRGVLQ